MQIQPTARVCPTCGAPMSFPEDAREVTCSYCQGVFAIDQSARKAREDAAKVRRIVVAFVVLIVGFIAITTIGSMVAGLWMQQKVMSTVGDTQKRAFREACRARCPGECRMRDPKAKDIGTCIDTCQARCDKD